MINHVKKVWGSEDWLVNTEKYCAKFLNLNRGYECSLHYHRDKDETFYILGGTVELYYIDTKLENVKNIRIKYDELAVYLDSTKIKTIILKQGEQFRVKPYLAHKFRSLTSNAKILEVSTNHNDNDSYRITNARKLDNNEVDYGFYE